ncbi:uncharacterized protein [Miscanthus floridulus]|uniref:uncharacterized protein n=1 Tax=Miscanthus floridulus TaxID=154761 RepID=UPI003458DA26
MQGAAAIWCSTGCLWLRRWTCRRSGRRPVASSCPPTLTGKGRISSTRGLDFKPLTVSSLKMACLIHSASSLHKRKALCGGLRCHLCRAAHYFGAWCRMPKASVGLLLRNGRKPVDL